MSPRNKIILAISIFFAVSVILIIVAIILKPGSDSTTTTQGPDSWINKGIYVDPDSGKTIIGDEGQTVEAASQDKLIFGTTDLLELGLTSAQVSLIRVHLGDYMTNSKVASKPITQISIVVSTLRQKIGSGGADSYNVITSDIRLNKDPVQKLEIRYVGLTDALVIVYNKDSNKQLYVSESDDQD